VTSPAFSVIIPAYNSPQTIGSTISSVLRQTRKDFELIVVDDGSTDETPEIVRSFEPDARLKLIEQQNQGTAGARNTGVRGARGTYVSFLDHDDLWMPNYLEVIGETLGGTPEAGFAYADGWRLDDASKRVRRRTAMQTLGAPASLPAAPEDFLSCLVQRTFIRSATTIRRSVLEEVGPFDVDLSGVDDFDLWVRILLAGHRAVQAPGMLVIFRDHPGSLAADGLRMCVGRREVLRRIAESYDAPPQISASAAAQIPALDHLAAAFTGQSPLRATLLRGRLLLGKVKRAILARRRFHRQLPHQVAAALRDLEGA
jgi:glycosyltransferase involved in cell wall biosynthesis